MNNNNFNNKQALARNKPKRTTNNNSKRKGAYRLVVPAALNSFLPQSMETTLKYIDGNVVKNNAGNQFVYWRMRMGDCFDPDPLVLSGSVSGFAEYAALYRRYLVLQVTVKTSIVNREAFPVSIQACPSDIDLAGLVTNAIQASAIAEYPQAVPSFTLSGAGGMDRCEFTKTINLPTFTGQRGAYLNSLSYSALNNTSPSTQLFWNFTVVSATNLVLGIEQRTVYHYRVLWTQRQQGLV